ncbi:MAG TPA: DUF2269 family protein [Candidatus Sulfomarinibacteraceae bacterium]|nr:DUF2269 family protein [Candidatus Sulfomarinibacteraceae bacterium]
MNLFPWLLYAHILGAIIAFGPTFSHRFIGAMGGAEPQHRNFALRVSLKLAGTQTIPLAIVQGVTGVGLIFTSDIDFGAAVWLQTAIVLYVITVAYALAVQTPAVKQLVEMTAGGPPPAGAAAGGPPPAAVALVKRVQRGGMFLAVLVVTIVFLMVIKPAF